MFVVDASELVPAFSADPHSSSMKDWMRLAARSILLVDFAALETAAAVTKAVKIRDPSTKLSAGDALYVAVAANDRATLVTFDSRQAAAAELLGVACIVPA